MTDGQNENIVTEEERTSRKAAIWLGLLAAALVAAGAGYWTASRLPFDPPLQPGKPVAATPEPAKQPPEKQAEAAPAVDPAKVEATAKAAVEVTKPAEPAPAVESKPAAAAPAQQAAVEPNAAATETSPAVVAEPAPVPEQLAAPVAPSFDTVRVEPTGDTVIAGRAEPGTEVKVLHNGVAIGSVTASRDGTFAFVSEKPLPAGAGALTLQSVVNGKVSVSEASVAVAVKEQGKGEAMVALVKPGKSPEIIQAPSTLGAKVPPGTVALESVDYDAGGNIVFSGRGEKGGKVRVYVDNALAGEVTAGMDGKWSFAGGQAVTAGRHTLRADALKADGSVASRVELPFLREEPAKIASSDPASVEQGANDGEPQDGTSRMVIQPGNNLWKLSRKIYGKGTRYTVIWEANKDLIRNPNLIYPGQVFVMPTAN